MTDMTVKASVDAGEPFFVWFNTTHMHFRSHVKPEYNGKSGRWQSEYHDVMIYHNDCIGEMLDFIDKFPDLPETPAQFQERCAQVALKCFWRELGHEEPATASPVSAESRGPFSGIVSRLLQHANEQN